MSVFEARTAIGSELFSLLTCPHTTSSALLSIVSPLEIISIKIWETIRSWGSFLERPGKLTGPVSYFEIKVSRKVGCVLASNEVHFVSLAEHFTV